MSENKELMIPITATAIELYEGDILDAVLDEIEKKALVLVPDISTKKGREAIRSNASDVVGCKTYLFQLGKDLTEDHRKKVKTTNDVRNRMEERLNTLRDKVRKPLTEYETAEKARVANIEKMIQLIKDLSFAPLEDDSSQIANRLTQLQAIIVDDSFGDLETPAFIEKEKSIEKLTAQLETVKQRETDQKELEELRQMKADKEAKEAAELAEKEQTDRDKRIREEAADKATKESAEREEKLKRELVEQEERAEREKQAAIESEQKRVKDAAEAERVAEEKREANRKHCGKIHKIGVTALMLHCNIDEAQSKKVITSIAKGNVPNVKINY